MCDERLRVLLVDDEKSLRESLGQFLERDFGYQVDAVASGPDALRLVKETQGQYDVALIDEVLLDGPDGIETMQQIRALYPNIEAIIFTGWGTESRQRAIRAGAFRYLEKPVDSDELAMLIRTAAQQVRLRDIGRAILTERDPDQVLASITGTASSLALADEAAIVLLDRAMGKLEVHTNTYSAEQRWQRHFKGHNLSREIIETGRVVQVPDTTQDERVDQKVVETGTRSFVGLPIPGEGGSLGALYVYSQRPGRFEEWGTVAVLQTLAGQAGLAIVNARAFQRTRAHAGYMEALVQAGQALTKMTRIKDQLTLVWEFVREQLKVTTFFVALHDKGADVLRFPLFYDKGQSGEVPGRHLGDDPGQWGITGHVVKTGKELYWPTEGSGRAQCCSLGIEGVQIGEPCQSCFYLPLELGDEIIGAVSIQSYHQYAFAPVLLDACRALGSQLSVSLGNARLFDTARRTSDQLFALNQVVLEMGKELDRQALLRQVIKQAMMLLAAEGGAVYLLDPTGNYLTVETLAGLPSELKEQRIDSGKGLSGEILRTAKPQRVTDYHHWKERLGFLDVHELTAVAGAPIRVGERILGTLIVHDTRPEKRFDDAALALLQQFADHAGLALQKAALLEKLRVIQQVSTTVTSSLEFQEVLNRTCQAAVELFGVDHSGLVIFDQDLAWGTVQGEYPVQPNTLRVRIPIEGVPAEEKLAFNGETLVFHDVKDAESELGPVLEILHRFDICSIAVVPIVYQDRVLGSFSLDAVGRTRQFTPEEIELCRVFAAHVAVAIENARLFSELTEIKEWWEALIENAFDAMIAIDQNKRITVFNQRAEEMSGWTTEEMIGQTVARMHVDVERAKEIWDVVNREGAISNWEVELKHRDGTFIPALLSVNLIRGSDGYSTWQGGSIRDLRQVNLLEDRLRALIRVGQTITSILELDEVLGQVIQAALTAFPVAQQGSIHLYDEQANVLCLKANTSGHSPSAVEALRLESGEGIAGWVFQHQQPLALDDAHRDPRYKRIDHPEVRIHKSIACVPLKVRGRVIGVLSLDNLDVAGVFQADDLGLLSTFADQVAIAIDNARLYQEARRRQQLLRALDEASRHIRAEKETFKLLHEIVRLAAWLVDYEAGCLFIHHPYAGELELSVAYGLPVGMGIAESRLPRTEGLVGLVARTGNPQIVYEYSDWPEREDIFAPYNFRTAAGVPLKQAGEVEAVLFVADNTGSRQLGQTDFEILERFAAQAAIALHASRLMSQEQRMFSQLSILHQISDYIQEARDLDNILHVVLTGVTAGYGLGFNRAALLLLDDQREYLAGRMGIGYLDELEARQDWDQHRKDRLDDFQRYLEQLEQNSLPSTPVGKRIREVRLPVTPATRDNFFSQAMGERRCTLVTQDELDRLPETFVKSFEPALPLVMVPLMARDQAIGLLVVDNKFTKSPVTPEDEELLLTFANTAAVAIENTQLFLEAKVARERLRSFYKASSALVSSENPGQVLQDIVERARVAANSASVRVILIDEVGYARNLVMAGTDKQFGGAGTIRPDGLSMQVMRSGQAEVIEDTNKQRERVNPAMLQESVAAALCLPLSLLGRRIGVMWVHYDAPRHFPEFEIEALQLYVNQAAIAYDSARWIQELEHLHRAAEKLASVAEVQEILQQIVESAREVLGADSAVIWSYDAIRQAFLPDELVADGIAPELVEKFREDDPRPGGTAEAVIQQRYLIVTDVDDPEYAYLGLTARGLRGAIGAKAFQGIALREGDETLGVLYVNYGQRRSFTAEDWATLETFAYHAALSLKRARLLEQVGKAQDTAKAVAQVTVLGDREATLMSVVQGTKDAVGCDAVTLFVYNQLTNRLEHPPTMVGVNEPGKAMLSGKVLIDSLVYEMLRRDEPYIVEKVVQDPLFKERRFAKEEGIKSCVAIPLEAVGQKVGVMFVNYRTHHRFTGEELSNIVLFATQAAIAIRNARLLADTSRHGRQLQTVAEVSKSTSTILDPEELMNQAVNLIREGFDFYYVGLFLVDEAGEYAALRVGTGEAGRRMLQERHKLAIGGQSMVGWSVANAQACIAPDVGKKAVHFKNPHLPKTRSEIALPLISRGLCIGALTVQSTEDAAFSEGDITVLQTMADQLTIAIENAQLYRQATERLDESQALQRVATSLAGTLELAKVLRVVVTAAMDLTDTDSGSILLWDSQQEIFAHTLTTTGSDRTLQLYHSRARREGGIARTIIDEQKSIVVPDTRKDSCVNSVALEKGRRALIGVPLISRGEAVGVLYVSSSEPRQFSGRQVALLESLASQAAVVIERASQYEELKQTKGLVGARTALAWMGMASSTWRHAIDKHALTIREQAQLLRQDWERATAHPQKAKASHRVDMIERLATQVLEKPITPPLSSEAGLKLVSLSTLVSERARQLWQSGRYKGVAALQLDIQLSDSITVWISPEWLRRAFDILVDNAVDAVAGCPVQEITIGTRSAGMGAEIFVSDTGSGISKEVQAKIGLELIEKAQDAEGLGMGLLMAQTIVQTYEGRIWVASTGPTGTTMVIWLPLQE